MQQILYFMAVSSKIGSMNTNDYRLNAYKKAGAQGNGGDESKSISKEIRHNTEPGHEPLVHKAMFQHINSQIDQSFSQKTEDEKAKRQASFAAQTGTYYSKKKTVTDEDVRKAAANLTSGGLLKVPEANKKPGEKESIYRRVAKFLLVIGIDEAAKIMPHLTEEQTEKIIPEIASIQKVTPEEATEVLAEFQSLVEKAREEGGLDTARTILSKAFGAQKAESMIEKSVPYSEGKPFEYLQGVDSDRIGLLLKDESPAVQSLVLSQVEPKAAAGVINKMNDSDKKEIILRLAKMKPISPEIIANIDKSLHEKMLAQNTENSENLDGRGALAQILKRMDPAAEQGILQNLSEQDPDLGADLRQRLFTEEDVIGSDDKYIQKMLRDMSDENIAFLIAGKHDDFRKKMISNVSENRAKAVLEEEALRKPMRRSDCEKVTSQFYAVLRRAWEDGKLTVKCRDDGEMYV